MPNNCQLSQSVVFISNFFSLTSISQWSPTMWWLFPVRSWGAPCSQPTRGCVFLGSLQRPESCRSPEILWRSRLRWAPTPNYNPCFRLKSLFCGFSQTGWWDYNGGLTGKETIMVLNSRETVNRPTGKQVKEWKHASKLTPFKCCSVDFLII